MLVAAASLALASVLAPAPALAAVPPHVATTTDPDTCAMCHRAHTGFSTFGRIAPDSWEMTANALAIVPGAWVFDPATGGLYIPTDAGDTPLCYVCHGVDALGSGLEVQSSFLQASAHSLAPAASPFGPSVKYCSSCHDAHGSDKVSGGGPYPALLRSRTSTGSPVFQAEEYCATCHADRPADTFDGLALFRLTAHYSAIPEPSDGTKIRCLVCHDGHGSAVAPLITSAIATPAVDAPVPVTANDRTLCMACHGVAQGTYPGPAIYATSRHATSVATVTVSGEWPDPGASRLVGECQVCHAPMGRSDGEGGVIPKLGDAEGRALCDRCHDVDGPAATDLAAFKYPPAAAPNLELVAVYSPAAPTAHLGRLHLFASLPVTTTPRPLAEARQYATGQAIGRAAVGDIDARGGADVVVLDPNAARITVFSPDPLKGISVGIAPGVLPVPDGMIAEYVAVADVLDDGLGRAEIVLVDADVGQLVICRYDDTLGPELITVAGPVAVGAAPSGIATGDVVGDAHADVVVTDGAAGAYTLISESTVTPGTLVVSTVTSGKAGVCGPSIGDVWSAAGAEIIVANSGEATDAVSVFSATGTLLSHLPIAPPPAGAVAVATLVADVMPLTPGSELIVALDGGTGMSAFNVYERDGAGLAAPARYETGVGFATGSLAAGDLNGDGMNELVVGNAGRWEHDGTLAMAPSIQLFRYNAVGNELLVIEPPRWAGGVEVAGSAPSIAVADLGAVSASRHPADVAPVTHVSTETVGFARHVTCSDCHDSHEAQPTPAAAPAVYGLMKGVFGVTLAYTPAEPVSYEYEVCLKCHSAYGDLDGSRDIGVEVAPGNASEHAIAAGGNAVARDGTFENGWTAGSILYCVDCHGSAEAAVTGVVGPHVSSQAPLLKRPYTGALPGEALLLCYLCHKENVYHTGDRDAGADASWFGGVDFPKLHSLHTTQHGFGCAACHESHGSATELHLLSPEVGFTPDPGGVPGGACTNACHLVPTRSYAR